VGNKSDLDSKRVISREVAETFATQSGMEYIETSAKENKNVDLVFTTISRNIRLGMYHKYPSTRPSMNDSIQLHSTDVVGTWKDYLPETSNCC